MKKIAGEIEDGGFFRKLTGTYVYLKLSESSIKYLKLDQDYVYGVCADNGNVVKLLHPSVVVEMVKNRVTASIGYKESTDGFSEEIEDLVEGLRKAKTHPGTNVSKTLKGICAEELHNRTGRPRIVMKSEHWEESIVCTNVEDWINWLNLLAISPSFRNAFMGTDGTE